MTKLNDQTMRKGKAKRKSHSKNLKMAPPQYGALGSQASDVLCNGYHFGLLKLDVKTKTATGVEFSTRGTSNIKSGKVSGNLETKYQVKDLGMTLTEKWTTDNNLNTTVDVVDKLVPGLKLSLDTKFAPGTGAKSGALKAEYKHDAAMITADLDLGLTALNASAVMGHKGWLA